MNYTKEEVAKAREALLGWLKPGDTVYTILRHVSRSGMQRRISLVIFRDGATLHPNWSAAAVLGYRCHRGSFDSLIVDGCGMDMGFDIVYNLGRVLFPKGFCRGLKRGRRARHLLHSHNGDAPGCHYEDGGYALRHEWL